MSYSRLGHDGYGNSFHYILDHLGVRHAGYAALGSDVCGDSLKGHNGAGTGFFCYSCLSLVSDIPIWCGRFSERSTCSALTTSMITPPFIIFARPALTVKFVEPFLLSPPVGPWPLVEASFVMSMVE